MKARVVRIDRRRMEGLIASLGDGHTPTVYTDRHFLVRELFWRRFAALLSLSGARARRRAMDFGGGNGVLTPTLSRLYEQVACVDLHTEMAEKIVKSDGLSNVSVHTGDVTSLGLPSDHFDSIIAPDVLEHIEDLPPVVAEFHRLLAPGGELLVSAPSENRFYELGRRVFGYAKPHDHYHPADFIERTVAEKLPLVQRRYFPVPIGWLGVFSLARFVKPAAEPV